MKHPMRTALSRATGTLFHAMPEGFKADFGIVLGTGFNSFIKELRGKDGFSAGFIPYDSIAGFHTKEHKTDGHAGVLHWGYLDGIPVVIMRGRYHIYEGYTAEEVTFPVRLLMALECKYIILTHAVGAINTLYKPGDFVFSTDHIGFFCPNPLIGPNDNQLGVRFPDMSEPYDAELIALARRHAKELNITAYCGVSGFTTGPTYETRAEVKALRMLGADIATMSVVPEVIVAAHAGHKVLAIAGVTNMCTGVLDMPLDHAEVTEMGQTMVPNFTHLVKTIIRELYPQSM